jgi:hypothetical protein
MQRKGPPPRHRPSGEPAVAKVPADTLADIRPIVVALRAAGVSFLKIGKALEAAGIRAPSGRWSMTTLHQISEADSATPHDQTRAGPPPRNQGSEPSEPPRQPVQRPTGNVRDIISRAAFKARFSAHLTKALVAHGIDAPERLLFMCSETEIHNIPGVGRGAVAEIKLYRDRFLPRSAFTSR